MPPCPSAEVLADAVARVHACFRRATDPQALCRELLDAARPALPGAFALLGEVCGDGAGLRLAAGATSEGRAADGLTAPVRALLEQLAAGDAPRRLEAADPDPRLAGLCRDPPLRALAGLPLRHGDEAVGVLLLGAADGSELDASRLAALDPLRTALGSVLGAARLARERRDAIAARDAALADITGRRAADAWLRDRDALLHKLTQQVPGVIHQLRRSPAGWLTMPYASEGLREAYELVPDDVRDDARPVFSRVHPDDADLLWASTLRSFSTLEPWRAVYRVQLPRAGLRWHEAHSVPERLPDGSVLWTGYTADITERKGYEEAMVAAAAAQRANQAKTEFLSRMSHELRTPLNAVLGFAQLLLLESTPLAPEERAKVAHIRTAGDHLLAMINDVLDLSRIESGNILLSLDVVQVDRAAAEAVALVAALAREHDVRVSSQPAEGAPLHVRADHVRLRQVLVNLLSNAIKYNHRGGRAIIDWRLASDGHGVLVGVSDTGPGLSPQQVAHLYEPFNRLGAERTPVEGTGIGLVLSRRLVELMHGVITVDSAAGRGSRFELWLPLASRRPVLPRLPPAGVSAAAHARGTLLYVEDNPLNVELVAEVLRLRPHWRLLTAGSGAEALALAQREPPDVLLLDMHLGDMTGLELARRLDRIPGLGDRPRIALTADALPGSLRRATEARFAAYLTKPVDVNALLRHLDEHMPRDGGQATGPGGRRAAGGPRYSGNSVK